MQSELEVMPMGEVSRVICGDARDVLKEFPDGYFQTAITSPPYW